MRFFSNHSIGWVVASLFTAVGLMRQSTGPAISVRLSGVAGCSSSDISATAARAATQGWHTASRLAPSLRKRIRVANGVLNTASSVTGTASPFTTTASMFQGGRLCVTCASSSTLQAATTPRIGRVGAMPKLESWNIGTTNRAAVGSGHIRSDWAW